MPEDAESFAALVRAAFSELAVEPRPSALGVTGAAIAAHLATGGGVTTRPDQAGLLWAEKDGGLYVSRIAVHPALRGQGLATALLQAAQTEARRRSLPRVWLQTRLALAGNRRLFAGCGFVETARHAHPGFREPTFVEMEMLIGNEPAAASGVNHSATR